MKDLAIPVNELHAIVSSDIERFLSDEGKQACADAVCGAVRTQVQS